MTHNRRPNTGKRLDYGVLKVTKEECMSSMRVDRPDPIQ